MGKIASAQQTLNEAQSLKFNAQGYQMDLMYQRFTQQGLSSNAE